MSEIDQINQDRRADARKPGGKKPGPKPSYETNLSVQQIRTSLNKLKSTK